MLGLKLNDVNKRDHRTSILAFSWKHVSADECRQNIVIENRWLIYTDEQWCDFTFVMFVRNQYTEIALWIIYISTNLFL